MSKRMLKLALGAALTAVAATACTGQIDGEGVVTKPELRQPEAEGHLLDAIVEPDALTLRYDGAVPGFRVGDVVWGTAGTGYLRKVTGVRVDGNTVHLATVNADINDGFEEIHLDGTTAAMTPMTPTLPVAHDEHITLMAGPVAFDVHLRYAEPVFGPPQGVPGGAAFSWELPEVQVEISEATTGQVSLSFTAKKLKVEKTVTLDAGMNWSWGKLHDMRFLVDDHTTYSLDELAVNVDGTVPLFNQAIPLLHDPALATLPVGPFVFTLGGALDLNVNAVLTAAGEVHTKNNVAITTTAHSGVTFDGSFHPVDDRTTHVDSTFTGVDFGTSHATLDASVGLAGSVRFALWGVIGPELYGQVTPIDASVTADVQGWKLALAANATGGVRFVLPFVKPDQLQYDFGSWEQTYYQTSGAW
jgi:hypothetical protein